MLKQYCLYAHGRVDCQPPSGGCVLKRAFAATAEGACCQPPSGGCVLKQGACKGDVSEYEPAAFGRLCVETRRFLLCFLTFRPAAFGRLCVETPCRARPRRARPAAFGRLCVETGSTLRRKKKKYPAAFGRLCVETGVNLLVLCGIAQPPSGGCVLKPSGGGRAIRQSGAQPPSGGCVLKHIGQGRGAGFARPAAFGRLCVETPMNIPNQESSDQPPSGGCVLKLNYLILKKNI